MREVIYSIPLVDTMSSGADCPLCWWEDRLTEKMLSLYMEGCLMQPAWRDRVLENGFCRKHLELIFGQEAKLGVAITAEAILAHELKLIKKNMPKSKKRLRWGWKGREAPANDGLSHILAKREKSCLACRDLSRELHNTCDNFWYLIKKEKEFAELVRQSKGFCLPHFRLIWESGLKSCRGSQYEKYMLPLLQWELNILEKTGDQLRNFIQQFDYRFAGSPMAEEKEAVVNGLAKLRGVRTGKKDGI